VDKAIFVDRLSKRFRRFNPDRPSTFQEAILRGLRNLGPSEGFWALQDVSFSVDRGNMVGVIGENGAGKSTLLRVVGGVIKPDRGKVITNGRIGALIDLGAGFHPDLTGRENVYINGIISGLTRQEVDQQFDSIVEFAELIEFIDSPLRIYSTGMQMRLAFAVSAYINPEILLIDEILAVGDISFQSKCLDRIDQFKKDGCAIILVSHDTSLVGKLCNEVLWLREGRVRAHGLAEAVIREYIAEMRHETERRTPKYELVKTTPSGIELRMNENRFGSQEVQIMDVRLLSDANLLASEIGSGEPLKIEILYRATRPVKAPIFGISITKEDGFVCYDTSTAAAGMELPVVHGTGKITLICERLDLIGGKYFIDVGVYKSDWSYAYDYHWHVYPINVTLSNGEKGILRPPHHWQMDGEIPLEGDVPELRSK
jgi:lipopolysaccharide transport system ATP-binding protein